MGAGVGVGGGAAGAAEGAVGGAGFGAADGGAGAPWLLFFVVVPVSVVLFAAASELAEGAALGAGGVSLGAAGGGAMAPGETASAPPVTAGSAGATSPTGGGATGLRKTRRPALASVATTPTATRIFVMLPFGFSATSVSLPVVPPAPHEAFVAAAATTGRAGGFDASIVGKAVMGVPRTREIRSAVFR